MKTKLGVVNVVATPMVEKYGYAGLQKKNLQRILGPDVELVFDSGNNQGAGGENDLKTYGEVLYNPFFTSLDGKVILEKLYKLQEEGCDGVVISCTLDPVLKEARALLRIPIVGTIEASVLSACMAGSKFSFLVHPERRCAEITEELVARYGLTSRMTPMVFASERYGELVYTAFNNPEIVREEIVNGCKEVIEKGAHSVILASTSLALLATASGIAEVPEYGAPVFDPLSVAARMVLYRIGLQRSLGIPPTSRAGVYRQFPAEFEKQVMQSLDFAF
jgi:Asp/Glu/hydantoin racemase